MQMIDGCHANGPRCHCLPLPTFGERRPYRRKGSRPSRQATGLMAREEASLWVEPRCVSLGSYRVANSLTCISRPPCSRVAFRWRLRGTKGFFTKSVSTLPMKSRRGLPMCFSRRPYACTGTLSVAGISSPSPKIRSLPASWLHATSKGSSPRESPQPSSVCEPPAGSWLASH